MHVLVTGIDGYVGSVPAPLLKTRGHTVAGIDAASSCSVYGIASGGAAAECALPAMRFHLVLNNPTGSAWATGEVRGCVYAS